MHLSTLSTSTSGSLKINSQAESKLQEALARLGKLHWNDISSKIYFLDALRLFTTSADNECCFFFDFFWAGRECRTLLNVTSSSSLISSLKAWLCEGISFTFRPLVAAPLPRCLNPRRDLLAAWTIIVPEFFLFSPLGAATPPIWYRVRVSVGRFPFNPFWIFLAKYFVHFFTLGSSIFY